MSAKIGNIYETEYSRSVKVFPYPDDKLTEITVMQSKSFSEDAWEEAKVNWPAIGSVSAEYAEQFVEAIKIASRIAKKWTKERCESEAS